MRELTPRQLEVVRLVGGDGLTYPEAADELGISHHTVLAHVKAICDRLGCPGGIRPRHFLRLVSEARAGIPKAG